MIGTRQLYVLSEVSYFCNLHQTQRFSANIAVRPPPAFAVFYSFAAQLSTVQAAKELV